MSARGQIRARYEYHEWANGHGLDTASKLSEEELAREVVRCGPGFTPTLDRLKPVLRERLATG
ncbi:MAG: hypothetical protein IIB19_00835 [Chloroflexi bacterium]|nr:hypothetical protein [Chloroflexota bacterium]